MEKLQKSGEDLLKKATALFWASAKYFFWVLLLVLYPAASYRYFFRFGVYPLVDFWFTVQYAFFIILTIMAFWSHRNASKPCDPGYITKEDFKKETANDEECAKCGCIKKEGAGVHHCSPCGRCVLKMDHHCPWTDNCVGYKTIKPTILFLFYVALFCA